MIITIYIYIYHYEAITLTTMLKATTEVTMTTTIKKIINEFDGPLINELR